MHAKVPAIGTIDVDNGQRIILMRLLILQIDEFSLLLSRFLHNLFELFNPFGAKIIEKYNNFHSLCHQ